MTTSRGIAALAAALAIALLVPGLLGAQGVPAASNGLEEIVVQATRMSRPLDRVPAAISVVSQNEIQLGRQQLGLDEALTRVPGLFMQNRYNFAQDLRVSIRGFGARSNFGIRGIKILVDGIPETLPDGQGQVDSIDLGRHTADRGAPRAELLALRQCIGRRRQRDFGTGPGSAVRQCAAHRRGVRRAEIPGQDRRSDGPGSITSSACPTPVSTAIASTVKPRTPNSADASNSTSATTAHCSPCSTIPISPFPTIRVESTSPRPRPIPGPPGTAI